MFPKQFPRKWENMEQFYWKQRESQFSDVRPGLTFAYNNLLTKLSLKTSLRVGVDVSAFIVVVAGGDVTADGTSARLYFDFK